MYKLAQKQGITLSAYNFNEAQHVCSSDILLCLFYFLQIYSVQGKDQCDRETALFKRYAETWLLTKETNKITNAKELLAAVFSNGGPKNTKMCVIQIDRAVALLQNVKNIPNISFYHSVEFKPDGAYYREFYEIGNGKFHKFNGGC